MQDVQNIPSPDVNSIVRDDDFGSHSDVHPDSPTDTDTPNADIERPTGGIPVPPDTETIAPVEEPPAERDKAPMDEGGKQPTRLV
jgi:hypothetical protein